MADTTAGTTWGKTFTLDDVKRLEKELALMPKPRWTLIAPDGRAWMDTDPQALMRVLASFVFTSAFAGMDVPGEGKKR